MTIPADYGQATLKYSGAALAYPAANVFGFANAGAETAEDAAGVIESAWTGTVMPLLCDEVTLDSVLVKLGPDATGPSFELSSSTAGGDADNPDRANTAYLVRKNTDFGGRMGRGRMYLPGVNEADVADFGTVSGAKVTALDTELEDFLAALALGGIPMVLLHGDTTTPYPVTSLTAQSVTATQRRRMRR